MCTAKLRSKVFFSSDAIKMYAMEVNLPALLILINPYRFLYKYLARTSQRGAGIAQSV